MTYQEALDYLYNQLPMFQRVGAVAFKKDLTNTYKLCRYFENPHDTYPIIHVAGTNGKGSVSHMIASVLQEQGYKVGLYTSPHLKSFTERIRVNGEPVKDEFVARFVAYNKDFFSSFEPSFFEITVAMAFIYFRQENVDIAIVETGMGGRLDSTNVVSPILSVITNIGYDHMQFLGETLPEIAVEKAGIIKLGVPVVIGEKQEEVGHVFRTIAEERKSPLIWADEDPEVPSFEMDLKGSYQQKNRVTAFAALNQLQKQGWKIQPEAFHQGFRKIVANTGIQGRWQTLQEEPIIIADTGHNKEGITYILEQLSTYSYKRLHMIIGFVNDKNIKSLLGLLPKEAVYYFTKADIPRALDSVELQNLAAEFHLKGHPYSTVKEALQQAKSNAEKDDLIFVGGSTFVVAEVI